MRGLRTILASVAMVATLASGFGMWLVISLGNEKNMELHKHLLESNPVRMKEHRERNELILRVLQEAAETDENITRRFGQK
ncbi:ubiquinol-cytochrome-c reductase complex assembly factor 3 [Electrophorus electricus]|uniref:Ubiquinol-cytochrome-c reductase complex assembly factor 3 n=1 Tax=Electrophorus electricus TaxID=8005 RepID=A0A4W4FBT3_ELEEL|nr:ubiquinol-cytochrome-c reductase complex assembly factor 3 [Electrophorus electricus]